MALNAKEKVENEKRTSIQVSSRAATQLKELRNRLNMTNTEIVEALVTNEHREQFPYTS